MGTGQFHPKYTVEPLLAHQRPRTAHQPGYRGSYWGCGVSEFHPIYWLAAGVAAIGFLGMLICAVIAVFQHLRRRFSPPAMPFGSNEEFSASDDPHCHDGGKACIDCLMRGECILFGCQTALPTDKD